MATAAAIRNAEFPKVTFTSTRRLRGVNRKSVARFDRRLLLRERRITNRIIRHVVPPAPRPSRPPSTSGVGRRANVQFYSIRARPVFHFDESRRHEKTYTRITRTRR